MERLDKFISGQKGMSRSDAKLLIKKGVVAVNGKTAKSGDAKINPEMDTVTIDGKNTVYRKHIYLMLNKPQGYVCATEDNVSKTVMELVPEEFRRDGLFPAGRLDKDTEGFVLITDDGEFAHRILSPRNHVPKVYYCELEHDCADDYAEKLANGVVLASGEKCLPAEIKINEKKNTAYLTISEGKFHQVKRMFEALGNRIIYLKRVKIGGLSLDEKLVLGACREIMHKEIAEIEGVF